MILAYMKGTERVRHSYSLHPRRHKETIKKQH